MHKVGEISKNYSDLLSYNEGFIIGSYWKIIKKVALLFIVFSILLLSESIISPKVSASRGDRVLSLYNTHTKESLQVTYKRNGRYIPSSMKKINWFLRDWRRDRATRMDPKVIDLVWELHRELGSRKAVHIISGFRSARTNAKLKRMGRNVARRSMHIRGKAMDIFFQDVSVKKLRNSALVRQAGGVGYYPRTGFVHVDTGRVRHWPRISKTQLASIFRKHKKKRYYRKPIASNTVYASRASSGRKNFASVSTKIMNRNSGTNSANNGTSKNSHISISRRLELIGRPIPRENPKRINIIKPTLLASIDRMPVPRAKPLTMAILLARAQNINVDDIKDEKRSFDPAEISKELDLSAISKKSSAQQFAEIKRPGKSDFISNKLNKSKQNNIVLASNIRKSAKLGAFTTRTNTKNKSDAKPLFFALRGGNKLKNIKTASINNKNISTKRSHVNKGDMAIYRKRQNIAKALQTVIVQPTGSNSKSSSLRLRAKTKKVYPVSNKSTKSDRLKINRNFAVLSR